MTSLDLLEHRSGSVVVSFRKSVLCTLWLSVCIIQFEAVSVGRVCVGVCVYSHLWSVVAVCDSGHLTVIYYTLCSLTPKLVLPRTGQ